MQYDLIIIGGGAAGFAAAMKANEKNAETLLINNDSIGLGGTCVNVGCVPTKYLLNISDILYESNSQKFTGLSSSTTFNFSDIIKGKNDLVNTLQKEKYEKVLKNLKTVEFINGDAKFISETEIIVNRRDTYSGQKFIIATGSSTFIPSIKGLEKIDYLTNISALQLRETPKSLVVLGGGALGLEFAQVFSRFGSKVILLEMMEKIVTNEEPEISNFLFDYLSNEGIEIYTNCIIEEVGKENGKVLLTCSILGNERLFKIEDVLIATGRKPNTADLGLDDLNLHLGKKGEIIVDENMKASDNFWPAGDVTGEPMLETVAAREGMIAANNALSDEKIVMKYDYVPHAIFTDPQVDSVGLTDLQANQKGFVCSCRTIPLELVPKAGIIKKTQGAIKMVIYYETEEILGIHILAPNASDLIHEAVMVLKNKMKLDDVIKTVHIFPTLFEGIKLAAQSFKRDITNMTCCAE